MQKTAKVAIIGLGNIGQAIAENFNKSNRTFIVAGRNLEKVQEIAKKWHSTTVKDIKTAVKETDIIIPAIYFQSWGEFFEQYAKELEGKTIIDPSNPIAPDENGGFKKIISEKESAGEILASKLPKNTKLVKAFGSLGVASLSGASLQKPERAVIFYADCQGENPVVEQLIKDSGFDALRIGGLEASIRMEVFGDLHEFGALGKTITLSEAKQKI